MNDSLGHAAGDQHDSSQADATTGRLQLLEELRRGIDRDELHLFYQPRIRLPSGLVDGVEALVRWQHPAS